MIDLIEASSYSITTQQDQMFAKIIQSIELIMGRIRSSQIRFKPLNAHLKGSA